jgi:hypothetical protein
MSEIEKKVKCPRCRSEKTRLNGRILKSGDSVAAWKCYVEMIETLREILKGGIQAKLETVK